MSRKLIMVCPKCGSTNVHADLSKDMIAWGGSTRWICDDCDHSSTLFPKIKKSDLKEYRKEIKQRTEKQEKVIVEPEKSKGISNKIASRIILFIFYGWPIAVALLLLIGASFIFLRDEIKEKIYEHGFEEVQGSIVINQNKLYILDGIDYEVKLLDLGGLPITANLSINSERIDLEVGEVKKLQQGDVFIEFRYFVRDTNELDYVQFELRNKK